MNLPAPFTEYTRALLGNEEYEKLSAALDQAPCQHPAESIVPHRCQFPQFSHLPSPFSLLPCALVSGGALSRSASDVYFRPSFPYRLLLCAGSFVDVRWASVEAVCFRRTGGDARSLCRSRWKIDSCLVAFCPRVACW